MKIGIFYSEFYFYVSSFHPRLIHQLKNENELELINVSNFNIEQINSKAHTFDLLVIDHSILMCSVKDSNKNFYKNIDIGVNNKKESFYLDVFQILLGLKNIKKLFWFHGDPHGISYSLTDRIEAIGEHVKPIQMNCIGLILAQNINKYLAVNEMVRDYSAEFKNFNSAKENLQNLVGDKLVIELPHCVDEQEQSKAFKIWKVCVPGVSYTTRSIATNKLLNANIRLAPYRELMILFDVLIYKIVKFTSRKFKIILGYKFIRFAASSSKITFVCGSALQYFVRKFVEIPLYNTTMLCYPSKDMHDYGFIDGIHCVHCLPEDAGIEAKKLLTDPAKMQRLRDNAKKLVLEKHTTQVRAQQLIKALQLAAEGKLVSSYFKDGEYIYETK